MTTRKLRLLATLFSALLTAVCIGCNTEPRSGPPQDQQPTATTPGTMAPQPAQGTRTAPTPAQPIPVSPPNVKILSAGFQRVGDAVQLAPLVQNFGPGMAKVDGGCQWKCPAVIRQISGSLSLNTAQYLNAGDRRILSTNMTGVCDDNPVPIQLGCTFTVQGIDSAGKSQGAEQTIPWSGTAIVPPK